MNSAAEAPPASSEPLSLALVSAETAAQCLALAAEAEGQVELQRACLQRAVALDRRCQPALLNLAALSLDEDDTLSTFGLLEEAARIGPLPAEIQPLHEQLRAAAQHDAQTQNYLRVIGRLPTAPAPEPLSLLMLCGRMAAGSPAAELARRLLERGHQVKVLTTAGASAPQALDPHVLRSLAPTAPALRDNLARVRTALQKSRVDLVVVPELAPLDVALLQPAFDRGTPVVHLVDTPRPEFAVDAQPVSPLYTLAPVSEWTGTALRNAGYQTERMEALPGGVALERHFRLFLPDTTQLRLAFVAPLHREGGADTFVQALVELAAAGVAFTAELAGDGDATELQALLAPHSLADRVRFLPADQRDDVLARCNVAVFAAATPEPLPLALAEAMAAGLVVASTGLGGAKEIVRHDVDGLLFRPADAADLAGKLGALSRDPERFAALQRAAQARAATFSAENQITRLEQLGREMIAAARAAADPLGGGDVGSF